MLDMLLFNGMVRTIEADGAVHEAIGVKDGRIAFVGSAAEAAKLEAAQRIDLAGKTVLPGFVDTHLHLMHYSFLQSFVQLFGVKSPTEIIARGREFADLHGVKRGFMLGWGWDQNKFDGDRRFPTRRDLDKISTKFPIIFSRVCGHVVALNSAALKQVLALPEAMDLREFINEEDGVLLETAAMLYTKLLGDFSGEEIEEFILRGQKDFNRAGITSIHSVDFLALPGASWQSIVEAYERLDAAGKLTARTYEQCMFNEPELLDEFLAAGRRTGQGSDMFRIGPVKLMVDGSLGARTAWLNEPYSDAPSVLGKQVFAPEVLRAMAQKSLDNNMQLALHGIGDRAIETAIELVTTLDARADNPARHGIIHAQLTNERSLAAMRAANLVAFIQPVFIDADMNIAEARVGAERLNKAYAWKTMRDIGIVTVGGSDSPVEPFDVLENIYFAVTSKNRSGLPAEGWMPQERLTVDEAVRLFTADAVYPSFMEDRLGTLAVGKYADMAVLDRDIYTVRPEEIREAKVVMTIVGGKIVWCREE